MPRVIRCVTQLAQEWRGEAYGEVELERPSRFPRSVLLSHAWEQDRVVHYWYDEDEGVE